MQTRTVSVTIKIAFIMLIAVLVIVAVPTWFNVYAAASRSQEDSEDVLYSVYNSYRDDVILQERFVAGIANSLAERAEVKWHLRNDSRDDLLALMEPVFNTLHEQNGIDQLFIYDADGRVVLRAHDPDNHGDFGQKYPIVADVLARRESAAGTGMDLSGFGVRAVTPIHQGDVFIGMVGVGVNFDAAYIDDLKARKEADFAIWLTPEPVDVGEFQAASDDLMHQVGSGEAATDLDHHRAVLRSGTPATHFFQRDADHMAMLLAPLYSYDNTTMGVLEITRSRTAVVDSLQEDQALTIAIAAVLIVLGVILTLAATHIVVLRPLRHLNRVARQQYQGDMDARVTLLPADEFGQLGESFNSLSQKLAQTLKQQEEAITSLTVTQSALEDNQRMLQAIVDNSTASIYVKDADSRYLLTSPGFLKQFGLQGGQVTGRIDQDLLNSATAAAIQEHECAVVKAQAPLEHEETVGGKTYQTLRFPLQDANGVVYGLCGIATDITERTQMIAVQQQTIRELASPVIPVLDQIIIMPLIGSIDSTRARDITRDLLAGISRYDAAVVILDITGVPFVDSGVAAYLNRTIGAARLKGTHTILAGISDAVAETIVDLGIDWRGVETVRDLQTGLLSAMKRINR